MNHELLLFSDEKNMIDIHMIIVSIKVYQKLVLVIKNCRKQQNGWEVVKSAKTYKFDMHNDRFN